MENITEIKKLSETRLIEAELLFHNELYDGCIYLAGYSVELLLKAKIAELLDVPSLYVTMGKDKIKAFRIHKLTDLAIYAGLFRKISETENEAFKEYWSYVYSTWTEELRYEKCGSCTKEKAQKFLNSIRNPENGIKKWIEEQLNS